MKQREIGDDPVLGHYGKRVSRPPLPAETVKQIKKLRRQKKSLRVIAKELGVGLATVQRYAQTL